MRRLEERAGPAPALRMGRVSVCAPPNYAPAVALAARRPARPGILYNLVSTRH